MGRPRRNSNKSDSGSTAGNVYNASLAAAQKGTETVDNTSVATPGSSESTLTPKLDSISIEATTEIEKPYSPISIANIISPVPVAPVAPLAPAVVSIAPVISVNPNPPSSTNIHRRSLSIAELVSLVSSRNPTLPDTSHPPSTHHNSFSSQVSQALNALNLPEALRSTLEKADSPILNALLPLIRQKLAAKTASNRRNSAVDASSEGIDSTTSLDSQASRRSSTSSRSEDHRLSHKLAERKRRKEMKDVFDNLKDSLPPGVPKSSKWEILNEASVAIDDLLEQEQHLLNQRNQLLKKINENNNY